MRYSYLHNDLQERMFKKKQKKSCLHTLHLWAIPREFVCKCLQCMISDKLWLNKSIPRCRYQHLSAFLAHCSFFFFFSAKHLTSLELVLSRLMHGKLVWEFQGDVATNLLLLRPPWHINPTVMKPLLTVTLTYLEFKQCKIHHIRNKAPTNKEIRKVDK